jgi:hypothetical protein
VGSYHALQGPVSVTLRRPGPFWFDNLAPVVAEYRWSRFLAECGLDKFNYGTARALDGNPYAERNVIGHLKGPIAGARHVIIVECLRSDITKRYRDLGLEFYSPDEILGSNLFHRLDRAIQMLKLYRTLRKTDKTDPVQVVFYDPGVGTLARPDPWTKHRQDAVAF